MNTKKPQEKWLNKKRFQCDWDSTDEDEYSQPSHFKTLRKNSLKFVEKKKTLTSGEGDDEQYLSDIPLSSRKRFHSDNCIKFLHNQPQYRPYPIQNRQCWMVHENGRTKGFSSVRSEEKNNEQLYIDENSDFEDRTNTYLERYKPVEFTHESLLKLEEYLDMKLLATDFWKEETMEDSNYVKDAKPYLQDSDKEDSELGNMTGKCHNGVYATNAYSFLPKIIQ